jgi:citrate synthase
MKRTDKDFYKASLRNEQFASRISTRIWAETPSQNNPYVAEHSFCHGYDIFELINKRSFLEVLYLLFNGDLPNKAQTQLLEALFIGLITPGPRHPATRAAMYTGIGKTDISHILPISLLTLGGHYLGGSEVIESMRFLNKHATKSAKDVAHNLIMNSQRPNDGDWHIAPGFGSRFDSVDLIATRLARTLFELPGSGKVIEWGIDFAEHLEHECGCAWLNTGVAAAALSDLGFHPRTGAGLFQIMNAPGLLAHGLEMSNKPLTSMPFIDNEHYVIESKEKK